MQSLKTFKKNFFSSLLKFDSEMPKEMLFQGSVTCVFAETLC